MMSGRLLSCVVSLGLCLSACDDFKGHPQAPAAGKPNSPVVISAPAPATDAPQVAEAAAATPTIDAPALPVIDAPAFAASANPLATGIDKAAYAAKPAAAGKRDLLIKAQVLLDRAHFSPGVIDGRDGSNFQRALLAYEQAHGLAEASRIDAATLQAMSTADTQPITADYVITADDVKGPFLGTVPVGMEALSKLTRVGYATPAEALAEKFHMAEALLRALNPSADFATAGTTILVVRVVSGGLGPVTRIEVDKSGNQLRAYDAAGKMVAMFPATVGSSERPAPSGDWAVKSVSPNPNYTYDPKRLTFGDASKGKLTIPPGPNNPVGSTWIALSADTFGIHGTPNPDMVGKAASHGCVRLTNWDAATLAHAVKKGVPVTFVGTENRKA